MIPNKTDVFAQKNYFDDVSFSKLMRRRIHNILLISSVYDAFMLDEDGRIDEQIFYEYMTLNLRFPPRFLNATNEKEAFAILKEENIDLVITMLSGDEKNTFQLADDIKQKYPDVPIVVLTPFSREVNLKLEQNKLGSVDHVFSWLGNADILLAIIKVIEDEMNVEHDVQEVGVQTIILVEDNIRFYSSYLPNIYKIIFKQSKAFMTEGLNEHQKMIRARGRPKILLATNYEEAIGLYEKYKNNLLGVISDMSYNRNGKKDPLAGIRLVKKIKKDNKYTPILLQSSDQENKAKAKELKVGFIDKNSKSLTYDLREFIKEYFAFGDFVFKDPDTGEEVERARDLKDLQEKIFQIPEKSLQYHIERDHISKWLRARALFPIATLFQSFSPSDFADTHEVKTFIFNTIANFRITKSRGVIAQFERESFDEYFTISRIGEGSIGGKARGLAFLDSLIKRNQLYNRFKNIDISIPKTVVLCTDIFDEFMEDNGLYPIALSDEYTDEEILKHFINASLPERIHQDLRTVISLVERPVAIRSSSLLEDSHYQPFAGIYNTYMIPLVKDDQEKMFLMIRKAIKAVYASSFYKDSKAYMRATANVIDEEKMAIVLQTVNGSRYGDRFYPTLSGVARSIDYYPIPPEKPEDGTASIALGLGKYVVDGGLAIRFSPKYPKKILQLSTPEMALKETQKYFYALDQGKTTFDPTPDDSSSLLKLSIREAEKDGSIKAIASTYDLRNNVMNDGYNYDGKKLITFAGILKHNTFPIAAILEEVLKLGEKEMGNPVEIEFVMDLYPNKAGRYTFNLLQIRPIASRHETVFIERDNIDQEKTIIISDSALGNGIIDNIKDVVYVRPQNFDAAKNEKTVEMIDEINKKFLTGNENYVLIGPGRWGSADPWLGIPVKWPQISAARLIIESGLENYRIDPSQGTHFFQNLTSFGVGYFTINPFMKDGFYDLEFLDKQPAVFENDTIRHVRFPKPMTIMIDGKRNLGILLKPGYDDDENEEGLEAIQVA
ncbi:MAG TPA: PEP/pyruvate-binding domain-containing protein [Bacteroidales bacterium]